MFASKSSTLHVKVLFGLLLFVTILSIVASSSDQTISEVNNVAPRQVPPPPKVISPPKPKNPKPVPNAVAGTRKLAQDIIKKLLERIEGGEPPAVEGDVEIPENTLYPNDALAKDEKRKAPKGPETGQACAGEECEDTQTCVHMAGRRFQVRWFTCCASGRFADFHGNCCEKKLDAKHTLCP